MADLEQLLQAQNQQLNNAQQQLAQAQQQLTQAQQQFQPQPRIREPKIAMPDKFGGDKNKLRTFLAQCDNTFAVQPSTYGMLDANGVLVNNTPAVMAFVGNLLVDGPGDWFASLKLYSLTSLNNAPHPSLLSWTQFKKDMILLYDDPAREQTAMLKLEELRQGDGSVSVYASKFRQLALDLPSLADHESRYCF